MVIRLFPFIVGPIITNAFGPQSLAPFIDFYSVAGIIIVLLSHGMETTFFRFAEKEEDTKKLISTAHSANEGGRIRMALLRITHNLSDITTNVSEYASNVFIQKKAVPKCDIVTVYNGINIEKFKYSKSSSKQCQGKYICGKDFRKSSYKSTLKI